MTDHHLYSDFYLVLGLAGLSVQSDWSFNYSYKTAQYNEFLYLTISWYSV